MQCDAAGGITINTNANDNNERTKKKSSALSFSFSLFMVHQMRQGDMYTKCGGVCIWIGGFGERSRARV